MSSTHIARESEDEYSLDSTFEVDDASSFNVSPIEGSVSRISLDVSTNYISSFSCSSSIAKDGSSASLPYPHFQRPAERPSRGPPRLPNVSNSREFSDGGTAATSPVVSPIDSESGRDGSIEAVANVTGTTGSTNYESCRDRFSLSSRLISGIAGNRGGAGARVPADKGDGAVSLEDLDRSVTDVVDAVLRMHPSATPKKQTCSVESSSHSRPSKQEYSELVNKSVTEGTVVVDEWRDALCPNTGRTYYYNRRTRETKWSMPTNAILVPRKKKSQRATRSPHASESARKQNGAKHSPTKLDDSAGLESILSSSRSLSINHTVVTDSSKVIAAASSVDGADHAITRGLNESKVSATAFASSSSMLALKGPKDSIGAKNMTPKACAMISQSIDTNATKGKTPMPPSSFAQRRPQSVEDDQTKVFDDNTAALDLERHLSVSPPRRRLFRPDGGMVQGLDTFTEVSDTIDDASLTSAHHEGGGGPHVFCLYCASGCCSPQMLFVHMRQCPARRALLENNPKMQTLLEDAVMRTWGLANKAADSFQIRVDPRYDVNPPAEDSVEFISYEDSQEELCIDCGRTFAHGRLASHSRVCRKIFSNRPKTTPGRDISWSDCESTPQRTYRTDSSGVFQYNTGDASPIKSNCPFCSREFQKGQQLSMHLLRCKKRQKTRERRRAVDSARKMTPGKSPKIQTLLTDGGRCLPGHPKAEPPRFQQGSRHAAW